MWKTAPDKSTALAQAIAFTGDARLYGAAMMRVISEWPISCQHNLSDITQNRRAWIGHAACALEIECPEDIVRAAWHMLTDEQRIEANAAADRAIAVWEENQTEGECPSDQLELTF